MVACARKIVANAPEIELCRNDTLWTLPATTPAEKTRAFEDIYWYLREVDEATQRRVVRGLADRYDVDMAADCKRLVMNWDELRGYASDPLVTIGAHTKGHFAIAKLSEERALDEATGVPLNASMHDYKIPTLADLPKIEAFFVPAADVVANHTGAKGLAEPPIIGVAPAIANAVADALGVELTEIPLTPWRVLASLGTASRSGQ